MATPREAERAARRLGFPVALKVIADDLAHKTEAGAVAINLPDARAVERVARRMPAATRRHHVEGLLVQRMVRVTAMLAEVRALAALRGFRGAPPADFPALVSALLGVARLAQVLGDRPGSGDRLVGLDVNPIIVNHHGAFAVDLLVETGDAIPGGGVAPFDRIERSPSERRAR